MREKIGFLATMCGVLCLLVVALLLSGCGKDGSITLTPIQLDGESINKFSGTISDASTIKEMTVHQTLQARDRAYAKAHKESGTKIKFKLQEVTPGVYVQVIDELSTRESPRFEQPLPTAPSEHPVWKTVDRLGGKALDTWLWWTGITEVADVQKHSLDAAQTKYYGNYNPQTAAPYIVEPTIVMVPQ